MWEEISTSTCEHPERKPFEPAHFGATEYIGGGTSLRVLHWSVAMGRGLKAVQRRSGVMAAVVLASFVIIVPGSTSEASPVRVQHSVALPKGARVVGPLAKSTHLDLTATLSSVNEPQLQAFVANVTNPASPQYRHFLTTKEFRQRFGAKAAVVSSVKAALKAKGFSKIALAPNGLSIKFSGTAGAVESTFHAGQVRLQGGKFANVRTPMLIGALAHVHDVVGLRNTKVAFSHATRIARATSSAPRGVRTAVHTASSPPLTPCADVTARFEGYGVNFPLDFADHYAFKALYDAGDFGQGVSIGIQQFESFTPSDIAAYQACLGTSTTVNTVDVNGGPDASQQQVGEAALDIEVVIGQAKDAMINVYQAANDGLSSYDLLSTMVTANADQILVTSWGLCENLLSEQATQDSELLFLEAAAQGQSFIAAAGDAGSQDCDATPGVVGVDSPASQPNVLGVGGTSRTTGADQVWNTYDAAHPKFDQAGGGGISTVSCMPLYQEQSATISGIINSYSVHDSTCDGLSMAPYRRQVPDVSAIADPATGYPVFYNGEWQIFGGTSAAAPLWASIGALIDASPFCSSYGSGFPGVQVASIYQAAADGWGQMFTDVTVGTNDLHHELDGLYPATTGYDQASGLGTPLVVGLDDQGVERLELPGIAARICHDAATTNKSPTVQSFSPSAILPGSPTTITMSGKGFLTIAGSTVVDLDADHRVVATCTSTTSCTFNSGELSTKVYSPSIEVEGLARATTPKFTVTEPTATSLVVTASPTAASYGSSSTLRADITPSGAGGSVVFTSGATTLCTGTLVSGTATCETSTSLGVGTYEVLASYGGDGPFGASSDSASLEVTKTQTAVTVTASPTAPLPGASVLLTTKVTPSTATGTVQLSIGNSSNGACITTLTQGSGSCTATSPLTLGVQPVKAYYEGDALHDTSSATGSLTVRKATSTTTMTRAATAVPADGSATWSTTVSPSSATGTVAFTAVAGGVATGACTAVIANGRASCTAAVLAKASVIKVTATYGGSSTVSGSQATTTYSVGKVASVFRVIVTPSIVVKKKPFLISVSGLKAKTTGVVIFKVGAAVLCSAPLVGGAGKCTAKAQTKPGRITVFALYGGDGAHLAATVVTSVTVR